MVDLSVCIPYVHSYPELIHTLFACQNELVDEGYNYELIVAENREKDPYTDKFLHYFRVPQHLGIVKYVFCSTPCGPAARMAGAKVAKGKWLMFVDAHTQPGKNTIPKLVNFLEENENVGIVHGSTMYSHIDLKRGAGCYYDLFGGNINLYSHFHGRYQRCRSMEPYPVAGASLAYMMVRREQFLKLRGYNDACRGYPHPEGYVPLKYWMFGLECWSMPLAWHLHSLYPRNYGKPAKIKVTIDGTERELGGNDNLIRNAMICSFTLAGEEWIDKVYDEWRGRGGHKKILDALRRSALEDEDVLKEREWIMDNAKYTLNGVLKDLYQRKVRGMEYYKAR